MYQKIEQRIVAERKMDLIDFKKVGAIGIVCCGISGLAIFLLVVELLLHKLKRPCAAGQGEITYKIVPKSVW